MRNINCEILGANRGSRLGRLSEWQQPLTPRILRACQTLSRQQTNLLAISPVGTVEALEILIFVCALPCREKRMGAHSLPLGTVVWASLYAVAAILLLLGSTVLLWL